MNNKTCPFLGLKEDPSTNLNFPSPGNYCHHARPAAPVKRDYQENFCLNGQHRTCPLFLAEHPIPMPAAILDTGEQQSPQRRRLATIGIPALIAGIAAVTFVWQGLGAYQKASRNFIPDTGVGEQSSMLPMNDAVLANPEPTPENIADLQKVNCPMPEGWEPYMVAPTDSLFRLSIIYGVSVEQLQAVNCMGNETAILPDQIIFVPILPTRTPSPTPTRLLAFPTNNFSLDQARFPEPSTTPKPQQDTKGKVNTPVPPIATDVPPKKENKPPVKVKPTKESKPPRHVKPTKEKKSRQG